MVLGVFDPFSGGTKGPLGFHKGKRDRSAVSFEETPGGEVLCSRRRSDGRWSRCVRAEPPGVSLALGVDPEVLFR